MKDKNLIGHNRNFEKISLFAYDIFKNKYEYNVFN